MPRYLRYNGKGKLVFLPAVANSAAPTAAEIAAGTPLTADFRESSGFSSGQTSVPMPDYVSSFTPTLAGRQEAGSPQLTFYDQDAATNATRTALSEGTNGFLLRCPMGQIAGRRCEVWPVTIGAQNDTEWGADNESAQYIVGLSVTSAPTKTAVYPA